MASEFKIIFQRYQAVKGSEQSAPRFILAENFNEAADFANLLLEGMQSCGDGWLYRIKSLESYGMSRADHVYEGPGLWSPERDKKEAGE